MKFAKLFGRWKRKKADESLPVRIRTINSDDATYDSSYSSRAEGTVTYTTDAEDMATYDSDAAARTRYERNQGAFAEYQARRRMRNDEEDGTVAADTVTMTETATMAETAMTSRQTMEPEIFCCGIYL